MPKKNLSAEHTAKLIVLNADFYGNEKDKLISRYKISLNTLRIISKRDAIREAFLAEVELELAELGWAFIRNNEDECCFMVMATTGNWAKLSSKRLTDLIEEGPDAIDQAYEKYMEL